LRLIYTNLGFIFTYNQTFVIKLSFKILNFNCIFNTTKINFINSYIIVNNPVYYEISSVYYIEDLELNLLENYNIENWALKYLNPIPINYWRYYSIGFKLVDIPFDTNNNAIIYTILTININIKKNFISYKLKDCILLTHLLKFFFLNSTVIIDNISFYNTFNIYLYITKKDYINIFPSLENGYYIDVDFNNKSLAKFF